MADKFPEIFQKTKDDFVELYNIEFPEDPINSTSHAFLETLMLYYFALRESHFMNVIETLFDRNLLKNAISDTLDELGTFKELRRRSSQPATVILRFVINDKNRVRFTIPQGTVISGGGYSFATDESIDVNKDIEYTVGASCTTPNVGDKANNIAIGQVTTIETSFFGKIYVSSVRNINTSVNGSLFESDTVFRKRVALGFSRKGVGSRGAYEYYAIAADPRVETVRIIGVEDGGPSGMVEIIPIAISGKGRSGNYNLLGICTVDNSTQISTESDLSDISAYDGVKLINRANPAIIISGYIKAVVVSTGRLTISSSIYDQDAVYDLYIQDNTVTDDGIFPTSDLLSNINTAVNKDDTRGINDRVIVTPSTPKEISLRINIWSSSSQPGELQVDVKNIVKEYLTETQKDIGAPFLMGRLIDVIFSISGVENVSIPYPDKDIVLKKNEIIVWKDEEILVNIYKENDLRGLSPIYKDFNINKVPEFKISQPVLYYPQSTSVQIIEKLHWLIGINDGDDGSQTLNLTVTVSSPELFSVLPVMNKNTGSLYFTIKENAVGVTSIFVMLQDSGSTSNLGDSNSNVQVAHMTVGDPTSSQNVVE